MAIAAELVLSGILLIPNLTVAAHFSPSVGYVRSKSAFEGALGVGKEKNKKK